MLDGIAARPASIAEWEDLLVRVEIAPRAFRSLLDDPAAERREVRECLAEAVARERAWARALEALRGGEPLRGELGRPAEGGTGHESSSVELAHALERLRTRNFVMAQRRGLDVWEWTSTDSAGVRFTVFQILARMVADDGERLARIRRALRAGEPAC